MCIRDRLRNKPIGICLSFFGVDEGFSSLNSNLKRRVVKGVPYNLLLFYRFIWCLDFFCFSYQCCFCLLRLNCFRNLNWFVNRLDYFLRWFLLLFLRFYNLKFCFAMEQIFNMNKCSLFFGWHLLFFRDCGRCFKFKVKKRNIWRFLFDLNFWRWNRGDCFQNYFCWVIWARKFC